MKTMQIMNAMNTLSIPSMSMVAYEEVGKKGCVGYTVKSVFLRILICNCIILT
jgi:hypothetical protein